MITTLKPPVFNPENLAAIKKELHDKGFAVVRVLTRKESKHVLDEFEKWIRELDPRIDLENPVEKLFPDNVLGIIKAYGIGHADFMWYIRNHPKVRNVFAAIWGCAPDDLICSFDGACYMPWQFAKIRSRTELWPHRDQHPYNNTLMTYQGSINLVPNRSKGDGGFVVWPETHKLDNWCNLLPEQCAKTGGNFFQINCECAKVINGITESHARRLIVPVGSLTLWDSRLIHCNMGGINTKRVVAYVCMVDSRTVDEEAKKKLQICKEHKRSTSHNPRDFTINDERVIYTNSLIDPLARRSHNTRNSSNNTISSR